MSKGYSKIRIELVAGKQLQNAGQVLAFCHRYTAPNGNHTYSNVMYVKSVAAGKGGCMVRMLDIDPVSNKRYTSSHWYAEGVEIATGICVHHDGKNWGIYADTKDKVRLGVGYNSSNSLVVRETTC